MNNKINDKEIKEVLKTAEDYMKAKDYMGAIIYYDKIFDFHDENYYHKAYFGLYLAWWNSCRINNKWEEDINAHFKNAILFAPDDKKQEYDKIYNENNKIFHKEDLKDEQ